MNRKLQFLMCLFGIALLLGCSRNVTAVTPTQASAMLSGQKAVIVDVREDDEWQAQHIAGAIHIPLGQVQSRISELAPYKNSTVIMQCHSGKRSAKAATMLQAAGFNHVYNLAGGIQAWDKDGFATVRPDAK